MKTLEKLKLHNLEAICMEDQKAMKGGGEWQWFNGEWTYMVDPVQVVKDVPWVTCGTVNAMNRSTAGSYSEIAVNAFVNGLANSNPVTSYAKQYLDIMYDVSQVAWNQAKQDAVYDVLKLQGYTMDSNICWSTNNNKLVVYDGNGAIIWSE